MSAARQAVWSLEELQAIISRCPYHRWLQLHARAISAEGVELVLPWREELMSSPEVQSMHGGVLAALVDCAASYAIATRSGPPRGIPTVDLRIDYHKVAKPGEYVARGRALKIGRTLSSGEAFIHDAQGALIASGRGVFLTRGAE